MNKTNNLRSIVFFIKDFLTQNSTVRKNLLELKNHFQIEENKTNESLVLENLLQYTQNNIPYYKDKIFKDFQDFPVIDKTTIKNNLELFISSKYKLSDLYKVSTSGSTGTPFSSYQDKSKKNRNTADSIYFGSKVGYNLGEKLFYIKLWNKINKKSFIQRFFQNITQVDVTYQSSFEIERDLIVKIHDSNKNFHLLAYASYYDALLDYLKKKNSNFKNLKSAIAMSEALSLNTQKQFFKCTGLNIYSRYSNIENGIIAQQTPESGDYFLVNTASYKIEILKQDQDIPVIEGELGRIVVTDLYNYGMPFIRYDTGDLGKLKYDKEKKICYLIEISGRKLDLVYDTKGRSVSSLTINNNMLMFPEIKQYQFIQKTKTNYMFCLNVDDTPYERENELKIFFRNIFGLDSTISIKYINEIPMLSSGKRKQVVNEMNK